MIHLALLLWLVARRRLARFARGGGREGFVRQRGAAVGVPVEVLACMVRLISGI